MIALRIVVGLVDQLQEESRSCSTAAEAVNIFSCVSLVFLREEEKVLLSAYIRTLWPSSVKRHLHGGPKCKL